MPDLTTDISQTKGFWSLGDFRPTMPLVSGRTALIHRLCVRWQTPRGRFPWWPNFGTDLTQYLLSKTSPSAIAAAAEAEGRKDEQVERIQVTAATEDSGRRIRLSVVVVDSAGPFRFTLTVDQAALTLIEVQAAA
jgi:hypothetical protein